MGLFDFFKRKQLANEPAGFRLVYINNALVMVPAGNQKFWDDGYAGNGVIYSIITKVAHKAAQVPFYQFDTRRAKSAEIREFKALTSAYDVKAFAEAKRLAKKAFMEVDSNTDPINMLMKRPNPGMSLADFTVFVVANKMIFGGCPIYANKGLTGNQVLSLYPFNREWLQLTPDQSLMQIKEARLLVDYNFLTMTPENLYMYKYISPKLELNGEHLFGFSPLYAGWKEIQKDNSNTAAQKFMYDNKGVSGYFKPDDLETSKAIQASAGGPDAVRQKLDELLNRNEGGPMRPFTPLNVSYNSFGMDAAQMDMIASSKYSAERIAQFFDYPKALMSSDASTFNNIQNETKYLVTNTIQPHITGLQDFWQWVAQTSGLEGRQILADITQMPEIQDDIWNMADKMAKSGLFTINEAREAVKYEASNDPLANEILVSGSLVPLSSLGMDEESGTL